MANSNGFVDVLRDMHQAEVKNTVKDTISNNDLKTRRKALVHSINEKLDDKLEISALVQELDTIIKKGPNYLADRKKSKSIKQLWKQYSWRRNLFGNGSRLRQQLEQLKSDLERDSLAKLLEQKGQSAKKPAMPKREDAKYLVNGKFNSDDHLYDVLNYINYALKQEKSFFEKEVSLKREHKDRQTMTAATYIPKVEDSRMLHTVKSIHEEFGKLRKLLRSTQTTSSWYNHVMYFINERHAELLMEGFLSVGENTDERAVKHEIQLLISCLDYENADPNTVLSIEELKQKSDDKGSDDLHLVRSICIQELEQRCKLMDYHSNHKQFYKTLKEAVADSKFSNTFRDVSSEATSDVDSRYNALKEYHMSPVYVPNVILEARREFNKTFFQVAEKGTEFEKLSHYERISKNLSNCTYYKAQPWYKEFFRMVSRLFTWQNKQVQVNDSFFLFAKPEERRKYLESLKPFISSQLDKQQPLTNKP